MLRLPDLWIWDSWIADDGGTYHLFFLQAPRSLGDPDRRHTAARIGHATWTDLVEWEYRDPIPVVLLDGALTARSTLPR